MSNENSQNEFNAARILASSTPVSADYALVISFTEGLNKEKATEEIMDIFMAFPFDARVITTESEHTSVIFIGKGISDIPMRKTDPSKYIMELKSFWDDTLIMIS